MKNLIIYDSLYGNTQKIAQTIAENIGKDTKLINVKNVKKEDLKNIKTLILGSPTHAGRPTKNIIDFINTIGHNELMDINITAFDTAISKEGKGFFIKTIINFFGYAAEKIAKLLQSKNGKLIVPSHGFFVLDKEGPLEKNQLAIAKKWALQIKNKI